MATQMSKSQLIEKIATTTEVSKKEVKNVMDTLVDVGHKELKKNGVFLVPRLREIRRGEEAGDQGSEGHQPLHGRGNDVQGQAGSQDRPGPPGQGRQGRGLRKSEKAPGDGGLFVLFTSPRSCGERSPRLRGG
ncbi:hypothetical protein V1287_000706 [Bradyrhizobium sp. AZCC 1699]